MSASWAGVKSFVRRVTGIGGGPPVVATKRGRDDAAAPDQAKRSKPNNKKAKSPEKKKKPEEADAASSKPKPKRLAGTRKLVDSSTTQALARLRGRKAIMCTCDSNKEKKARDECLELFNEYADKLYPVAAAEEAAETKSLAATLAAEASEAKRTVGGRFQMQDLGTVGVIYLTVEDTAIDPCVVVEAIMRDAVNPKVPLPPTRLLVRMMPLATVCYAGLDEAVEAATPLVKAFFEALTEPTTFSILVRRRSADAFPKDDAINAIAENLVPKEHKVDLNNPKVTILIEVFKNICGISIIPEFVAHHDYNIRSAREVRALKAPKPKAAKKPTAKPSK